MSEHGIECGDICGIIMGVPPNTGWIEQSYSKLEMICSKRRNQLSMDSMGSLCFMAIINLPVK